jgi:hypothetical protein
MRAFIDMALIEVVGGSEPGTASFAVVASGGAIRFVEDSYGGARKIVATEVASSEWRVVLSCHPERFPFPVILSDSLSLSS